MARNATDVEAMIIWFMIVRISIEQKLAIIAVGKAMT
jgi:hypothetical protein